MSETTVSVSGVNPQVLELELAIQAASESDAALRVNGARLQPLQGEGNENAAWLLDDRDGAWSIVGRTAGRWQVYDIFWLLDHADLVTRITSEATPNWREVHVVPVGDHWIVIEADPTGERELQLCLGADGRALWTGRAAARDAARRWAAQADQGDGRSLALG